MRFHLKGMLLLALSFVSFSAIADNVTTLELVQNSGETAQFELGKSPVVSTSHDSLVIADATREVRVALSEVKMYHFLTADATSINNVNGKSTAAHSFRGGVVKFDGLRASNPIIVATVDGKVIANVRSSSNGSAVIDLNAFGHGLYIVKTATGSYKFKF